MNSSSAHGASRLAYCLQHLTEVSDNLYMYCLCRFYCLAYRSDAVPNRCVLTVLLAYEHVQHDMAHQLPINSMRNQALLLAQTPLVAVLDVDLMVSSRLASALTTPAEAKHLLNLTQGQKNFVVLPAFDPPVQSRTPLMRGLPETEKSIVGTVLAEQQKLAQFASRSDKEALEVRCSH